MDLPNPPTWVIAPAKVVAKLAGHPGGVAVLAFSRDRGQLASAGRDGTARLWDIAAAPVERAALGPPGRRVGSLAFAPSGRFVAAGSGALDGMVWLFDLNGTPPLETVLRGARGAVNALAYSPDGTSLAGAGEDRTLRIWDAAPIPRADPRAQLPGHTGTVRALAFSIDGLLLASAADDSSVRIWSISRMRCSERIVLPHPTGVTAVAFTRDGQTLVTGCRDGVIRLWDAGALKPNQRAEFPALRAGIRLLQLPPDGNTLASLTDGAQVMHWDLPMRMPFREWTIASGAPMAAAITTDGRYVAAGTVNGGIELLRVGEKRG
jgi:WD40 repeat protein